jgi:drug/metabolite transporter (DMT)-like permease
VSAAVPAVPARTLDLGLRLQALGRRYPLALVGLGVVLYSVGPVLLAASSLSGPAFSFWRLWLGVPVLGAAMLVGLRAGGRRPDLAALRWPLWAGLAFGGHQLLFMTAVKATSVADVVLMNTLAPIITAVGAARLFGERPTARFGACTAVAIAGAGVIIAGGATGTRGDAAGMAMAVANVMLFAVFFLLSKRSRAHLDVLPFLFGTMLVAAVAVSLFVLATGTAVPLPAGRDLALCFTVAALPGALGHFVMTWPLQWVPANVPPVLRLGQPILAGLLAWALLGEPITGAHVAGGVLTVTGVLGAVLSSGAQPTT